MIFSRAKFKVIQYGQNKNLQEVAYTSVDEILVEKSSLKDLGVWLNRDCAFREQVTKSAKNERKMMGWILRTFVTRNPEDLLLPLWKSLVISTVEYSCRLWCPYKVKDIEKLEQIQRIFTRKLMNKPEIKYWERLQQFGLYSLQRRRERYSIICTCKILENMVPCPYSQGKPTVEIHIHPRLGRLCTRQAIIATSQRLKTIEAENFINFGPKLFDCLPRHIRGWTNCSTAAFKRRLKVFLKKTAR